MDKSHKVPGHTCPLGPLLNSWVNDASAHSTARLCFMPEQQSDFLATLLAGMPLKLILPAELFPRKTDGCKLAYLDKFCGLKNIYVEL